MKKLLLMVSMIVMMITPPLFSTSPTIILGLGVNSILYPDEEGLLNNNWFLEPEGLFSHRDKIKNIGYYSLFSSINAGFMYTEPYIYSDEEIISLETGFHFKNSKLIFITGVDVSLTGTDMSIPFYCPEWEVMYFFITERKKVHPFLSYQGYYYVQPEGEEDISYQGTEIGIEQRPSVTHGYKISLGIGWENWPEYPVYSDHGIVTTEIRNDMVCTAAGKIEGIHNFFLDWEIGLSVVVRLSNANAYIGGIDYINEKSEDAVSITAETSLKWGPSRYIHIALHPFFTPEIYFYKQALYTDGSLKGDTARAYTAGSDFYIDWTPDNSLYISFETSGMIYFSNHLDELDWNTSFRLGLEYSLKF